MRAIFMREAGDPEVLELRDTTVPEIGNGQILIEVAAAGVNRPDIAQRKGLYPVPKDASPILGLEVSGTVSAKAADVTAFEIGDRVFALAHGGGYATHCIVDARHAFHMPRGLTFVEAARAGLEVMPPTAPRCLEPQSSLHAALRENATSAYLGVRISR